MRYKGLMHCRPGLVCYILTDYVYQCIHPNNKDCLRFPSKVTSSSKDWRQYGYVSPVKNQDQCQAW